MLVQKGDVGIVQGGSRNMKTGELLKGDHAFMIVEAGELKPATRTVHLTWGGLQEWPYEHQGAKWICTCPKPELAARACDFAVGWVKAAPERVGDYSKERGAAVMHDIAKAGELPFEFDALRRAIKWGRRRDRPFSRQAGLTCAAWVVAAYQAAAFSAPSFDADRLDAAWQMTEAQRRPKAEFRATFPDLTKPKYREHANPGAKTADAMEQVIASIRPAGEAADGYLERLLTAPLVVDARFLHTDGLLRRLQVSDWTVHPAP